MQVVVAKFVTEGKASSTGVRGTASFCIAVHVEAAVFTFEHSVERSSVVAVAIGNFESRKNSLRLDGAFRAVLVCNVLGEPRDFPFPSLGKHSPSRHQTLLLRAFGLHASDVRRRWPTTPGSNVELRS